MGAAAVPPEIPAYPRPALNLGVGVRASRVAPREWLEIPWREAVSRGEMERPMFPLFVREAGANGDPLA